MPQTIPLMNVVALAISTLLAFALPIVVLVLLYRKYRLTFMPIMGGICLFLVTIAAGPYFVSLFTQIPAVSEWLDAGVLNTTVFLLLMNAFFVETGRLAGFYVLARVPHNNTLQGALGYGLGHGGMETSLLAGAVTLNYFTFALRIYISGIEPVVAEMQATGLTAADATLLVDELVARPASYFLAYGIDRIPAMAFHLAVSVLVWLAASGQRSFWAYVLAIALDMLYNLPATLLLYGVLTNVWISEAIAVALAVGICFLVFRIYKGSHMELPQ